MTPLEIELLRRLEAALTSPPLPVAIQEALDKANMLVEELPAMINAMCERNPAWTLKRH